MTNEYARCNCAECEKLDRLPVNRQGIPGAWQPNMLSAHVAHQPQPIEPMHAPIKPPQPWESLPLFGTLEPDLFA